MWGEGQQRISPERRARILALRREGLTYAVIAERIGCYLRTAYKICRAAALVRPCVCVQCGRTIPGRRSEAVVAWAERGAQAPLFLLVVCGECKPRWRQRLQFKGRVRHGADQDVVEVGPAVGVQSPGRAGHGGVPSGR